MRHSHEQIEGLLGQGPGTESLGAGFGERVAQGISGVEPGASPVAAAVLPASVKGAIMLGAVGVISAGVWVSATPSPSVEPEAPKIAENSGQTDDAAGLDGLIDKFNKNLAQIPTVDPKETLMGEGRKILTDAKRVGSAFVSVFPKDWTEMLWSSGAGSDAEGDAEPVNG